MQQLAYQAVADDLIVVVGHRSNWSQPEWQQHEHFVERHLHEHQAEVQCFRFLVFADDSGPDATQRSGLSKIMRPFRCRTAVLTDSTIARYLATAFGWMQFPIKVFPPTRFAEAASHLRLSREEMSLALSIASSLATTVGGCRAVAIAEGRAESRQRVS